MNGDRLLAPPEPGALAWAAPWASGRRTSACSGRAEAFGGDVPFGVLVQGFFVGMAANLIPSPAGGVGSVDAGMIFAFDVLFGATSSRSSSRCAHLPCDRVLAADPAGHLVAFFRLRRPSRGGSASEHRRLPPYTSESKVEGGWRSKDIENVVIVGSGPAGYTRACTSRPTSTRSWSRASPGAACSSRRPTSRATRATRGGVLGRR